MTALNTFLFELKSGEEIIQTNSRNLSMLFRAIKIFIDNEKPIDEIGITAMPLGMLHTRNGKYLENPQSCGCTR